MARSPSDATRFTATGPYASSSPNGPQFTSSQPSSQGSQISFGSPAAENETPQQKIARLRSAAALAKRSKESSTDRMIRIGRLFADRAHRVTAISLIGLTIITGMVATAGITDMLLHNRRKRNEWLAEKQAQSARDLKEAQGALAQGTATEDQMLLINRERAAFEADEAKRNRPGMFKKATGWVFGGLEKEERKGGRLRGGIVASTGTPEVKEVLLGEKEDRGVLQAVEEKVEENRRTGERVEEVLRPLGGPLDRQAEAAVRSVEQTGKSWTSWIIGR